MISLPLFSLLTDVTVLAQHGPADVPITGLTLDSRRPGRAWPSAPCAAPPPTATNSSAVPWKRALAAVICEELPASLNPATAYVVVADSAEALGHIAAAFHGHPSRQLRLIGVTGTNGKTTCATLLHKLLRELGYHAGLLSTVQNQIDEEVIPSTHTTPDAIRLNALLARMVAAGCTHACMEVSSHAVVQHRITGLRFAGGVFTNLTHDHLDYHGTFDNYLKAKKGFFDALPKTAFALTNADDKRGPVMLQNTAARRATYSLRGAADLPCQAWSPTKCTACTWKSTAAKSSSASLACSMPTTCWPCTGPPCCWARTPPSPHHPLGPDHRARPLRACGVGLRSASRASSTTPTRPTRWKTCSRPCTKSASPAKVLSRWWAAAATATRPSAPSWPTWPPVFPIRLF